MWTQTGSDQYWIDRQRDLERPDRMHGLVNSMSVTDRSELARLVSCTAAGAMRAGKFVYRIFEHARKSIGARPRTDTA